MLPNNSLSKNCLSEKSYSIFISSNLPGIKKKHSFFSFDFQENYFEYVWAPMLINYDYVIAKSVSVSVTIRSTSKYFLIF